MIERLQHASALCATLLLITACEKEPTPKESAASRPAPTSEPAKPPRPEFDLTLSPDAKRRANEILAVLAAHRPLLRGEERQHENFLPFLYLAATGEDDFVVSQSLQHMEDTFPPTKSAQFDASAATSLRVVRYWLQVGGDRAVAGALRASAPLLAATGSPELRGDVTEILTKGKSAIHAGLAASALKSQRPSGLDAEVWKTVNRRLKDLATPAVSRARLLDFVLDTRSAKKVDSVKPLLKSPEPVVRSLATRVHAAASSPSDMQDITQMLKDESPLVRASAARALGDYGDASAAVALLELIDDRASTHADVLAGVEGQLLADRYQLLMAVRTSVDVAALLAIEKLSTGGLQLAKLSERDRRSWVADSRTRALNWAATNAR